MGNGKLFEAEEIVPRGLRNKPVTSKYVTQTDLKNGAEIMSEQILACVIDLFEQCVWGRVLISMNLSLCLALLEGFWGDSFALAGHGQPRLAMAGFGWPRLVLGGHGWPCLAMTSFGWRWPGAGHGLGWP